MKKAAFTTKGTISVSKAQLYWSCVGKAPTKPHAGLEQIAQAVFDGCDIVILQPEEFDAFQSELESLHKQVKTNMCHGFNKLQSWHKDTDYHEDYLRTKGFRLLTKSTLVAVDRGNERYDIVFLYWNGVDTTAMADLCDYVYKTKGVKRARGNSVVNARSDKTMSGQMNAFGSWDARGPATVGLGDGKKEVRMYNPNGKVDARLDALVVKHVNQMSKEERSLAPVCAAVRAGYAKDYDPYQRHRLSAKCDAFAATISKDYVADPHNDSGAPGVLEYIKFCNATGPLPDGHKWLFGIAGFLCQLPNAAGKGCVIALPACGVFHGTLPTSSVSTTHNHGNYGSALITKQDVCRGMKRQLEQGKAAHPDYWCKYGNQKREKEYTCAHCYHFEGTYDEVVAHEAACAHK